MTSDCVSTTKTLMMGVKLMTKRYEKSTHIKDKGQCKDKQVSQKEFIYFLHKNDCKTPYIDNYIDLLLINFNLLSIL